MDQLWAWFKTILWIFLAYIIIKPIIIMGWYKFKYGNQVIINYFPVFGLFFLGMKDFYIHGDITYGQRKIIQKNPNAKVASLLIKNYQGPMIHFQFVDPNLIKQFLQDVQSFQKVDMILFNDLFLLNGLVFSQGEKWHSQRKFLGQHFTFEKLSSRIQLIKNVTKEIYDQKLSEMTECQIITINAQITGTIVCTSFFGQEFITKTINGQSIFDYFNYVVQRTFRQSFDYPLTLLKILLLGYHQSSANQTLMSKGEKQVFNSLIQLEVLIKEYINQRIDSYEENEKKQNQDFLQLYITEMSKSINYFIQQEKNPNKIEFNEIISQFITFFFAGMDTTSGFVGMACYQLSKNPDQQEKVRTQIKEIVSDYNSIDGSILNQLTYLNAFINETLRMHPPANQLFFRSCNKQTKIGDFYTQKGFLYDVGIQIVQNNPKYFENPNEFNLNRWLKEQPLKDPYSFIPFSAGPRNCIGQHMGMIESKIMIIYLLMNYKIIPDPKRKLRILFKTILGPDDERIVLFKKLK